MFQLVVAASIALGSEAVDGIFNKAGRCSSGSCSAATKPEAKAVDAKAAAKAEPKVLGCVKLDLSKARKRIGNKIFKRCR